MGGIVKKSNNKRRAQKNKSKLIDGLKGSELVFIDEGNTLNKYSTETMMDTSSVIDNNKESSSCNSNNNYNNGQSVHLKYCQLRKPLKNNKQFSDNYFVMQLVADSSSNNKNDKRKNNNMHSMHARCKRKDKLQSCQVSATTNNNNNNDSSSSRFLSNNDSFDNNTCTFMQQQPHFTTIMNSNKEYKEGNNNSNEPQFVNSIPHLEENKALEEEFLTTMTTLLARMENFNQQYSFLTTTNGEINNNYNTTNLEFNFMEENNNSSMPAQPYYCNTCSNDINNFEFYFQ
ncbi:hypothetical protein ABK040_011807 [Willaertia magna]